MNAKSATNGLISCFVVSALSFLYVGCGEDSTRARATQEKKVIVDQKKEAASQNKSADDGSARADNKRDETVSAPESKQVLERKIQQSLDISTKKKVEETKNDISKEAETAFQETQKALDALDAKKPKDALRALERATGSLEILLARDPALALAPIAVDVETQDVVGTIDDINRIRNEAVELLQEREVQKARKLLSGLVSEVVLTVTGIPLAGYPEAIKAISPLIDDGKIEEAKFALESALSTLVVTKHVIPIPVLRAELLLQRAEPIAEKKTRSEEDNAEIADLVDNASYQMKLARALGYGNKEDYNGLFRQLEEIEGKTIDEKWSTAFFDGAEKSLERLKKSVF